MNKRQALTETMQFLLVNIARERDGRIEPYAMEVGTWRALETRGYVQLLTGTRVYELTQAGRDWVAKWRAAK
jgi:hypothetical protein